MRILIADDDIVSRRFLEIALRKSGYEVISVEDGAKAWSSLSGQDSPQLAIIDWLMPGMDGGEVCRRVREHLTDRMMYLIVLTGSDRREDLIEALESGADDFLTKPYDVEELRARVNVAQRILCQQEHMDALTKQLAQASAETDTVSALPSKRTLEELLDRELARARRDETPIAAIMADVDQLDVINSAHGQTTGDTVLVEVARRFRQACRPYDVVGKYDNEELFLLLNRVPKEKTPVIAERLRTIVADQPIRTAGQSIKVTVSLGAAWFPPLAGCDADTVINSTVAMLAKAKQSGRNQAMVAV